MRARAAGCDSGQMPADVQVIRADAPERARLERAGWVVVAHSWGAQLDARACDVDALRRLAVRAEPLGGVRPLTAADRPGILMLDAATLHDYPGAEATVHTLLTPARAMVGRSRAAYGVVDVAGAVVAMTFVDVDRAACRAEVDFTVVVPHLRGRGLGTAVKAASVLDLLDRGVRTIRTGGSADNPAIIAANRAVGFVVDERWVTLKPAGGGASGQA